MIRVAIALLAACAPRPVDGTVAEPPPAAEGTDVEPPPAEEEPSPEDADSPCTKEECGPAMGMPNSPCPDGKTIAGPACLRDAAGKCGYVVIECPS